MWFGTINGLNRYDGCNFTIYRARSGSRSSISNNIINKLYLDRDGRIWVATMAGLNRFNYDTGDFTRFHNPMAASGNPSHDQFSAVTGSRNGMLWLGTQAGGIARFDPQTGTFFNIKKPGTLKNEIANSYKLCNGHISTLCEDPDGTLWFGSSSSGLCKLDPDSGKITFFYRHQLYVNGGKAKGVLNITTDRMDRMWIGTTYGLFLFNPRENSFLHFIPKPNDYNFKSYFIINEISEAPDGSLWIASSKCGLFRFYPESGQFISYKMNPNDPASLSHNSIQALYRDRGGILWIGTGGGGINKYNPHKQQMNHYYNLPGNPNSLNHNSVWAIHEEKDGTLLIGTGGGGLCRFHPKKQQYSFFKFQRTNPHSLSHDFVLSICRDSDDVIWVGTLVGLNRFNRDNGSFTRFVNTGKTNSNRSPSHNEVKVIYEDSRKQLWIGTRKGLNLFIRKTGQFVSFLHEPGNPGSISSGLITAIYRDSTGSLWIGTGGDGLNILSAEINGHTEFNHYRSSPDMTGSLSNNYIHCILENRTGTLWFGTAGGLNRFNRFDDSFTNFNHKNGLPSDIVYGILEDRQGNLWLSTNKGICRFNPITESVKILDLSDGLQGYEYNSGACFTGGNGTMFFGGLNGFNSFCPANIEDNHHIPPIVFTAFKIAGKPVPVGFNSPLANHISETDAIKLSYGQNIFSLEFAALDYADPAKNRYMYKMVGFSDQWIHLGGKHDVMFTNLDPGEYTLKVRGSNNDGAWNQTGASLKIIIAPPFWKTWWFQLLLLAAAAALAYFWHQSRLKKITLRLKTESEMKRIFSKYKISAREQEVVHLILKGKSNKDIEDLLFISMKTVKSHVYNIFQKFGVKNRLELINLIQKTVME